MGRLSEGQCPACGSLGRQSPWTAVLLAATILSSCFLLAQAQDIPITIKPTEPLEGRNITLTPGGNTSFVLCSWYRGEEAEANRILRYIPSPSEQQNGPKFTGRETARPGCSLHIRSLVLNDTGNYLVSKIVSGGAAEVGRVHIEVFEPLTKPSVSVFPTPFPIEFMGYVNLTCETTSGEVSVSWFYNGEPLNGSSRTEVSEDNRTVVIFAPNRNDTGEYQCQVTNPISVNISDSLYVAVIYGPDTPEIQPTETSYDLRSEIRLSCYADTFPKPDYIWFFDGKKRANTSELVIPVATLEDSGSYVCQAGNILSRHKSNATLKIEVVGENVTDVNITGPSTAIEYHTVQLKCSSLGSSVSYYWFKENQQVEAGDHVILLDNNKTLKLAPSDRSDSANYVCKGVNSFSSQSSEPHLLEIFYGPDSPLIDPQVSVYNEGSTLSLSCFADSNPPANYSWWYNGQLLDNQKDSQLLIQDLSVSEAGNYTCNAANNYTADSNATSIEITILERVSNVTINSHPNQAFENQPFVLECSSLGSNVSYSWSKGDQGLESGGHITLSDKNLTFSPAFRNDTGNYTCTGNNSFSSAGASYLLDVFYGPDSPLIDPQVSVYNEGSTLNLSCFADSNPPANYSWWYNDQPQEDQKDSQLLIQDLSVSEAGYYTCNATNDYAADSNAASIEITILERVSKVTINSHPNKSIENQPFVLECSSLGSNVSYRWSKGDQGLESGGHITLGDKNLTFSPAFRNDTGNYTCTGNNSFSSASASYLLDVFYGPDDPIINPLEHNYPEGSDLSISCQADSHPVANYTWFFNETEVGNGSQLLIRDLSLNMAGDYICNATNVETNISRAAVWEIQVLEKLFPPVLWPDKFFVEEHANITLNCTTSESSSVTVSWFKDGNPVPAKAILSDKNRTLTVPDISKDDEGTYTCEAGNAANSAMSNPSKVAVDSPVPPPGGPSAGEIVGIVIGCLLGVILIVAVLYFVFKSTASGRMESHSSNGNIPSAPGRNQGVTDTKPAAGEEDIQYSTLAFNANSPPQPGLGPTNPLESGTIYSVIKKK